MKRTTRTIVSVAAVIVALVVLAAIIVPGTVAPQVEKRLAEETGLVWRIGGAHLSPDLSLDLSDVVARDPTDRNSEPLFSAKTLALSGWPRLAFGGGATMKIAATDVMAKSAGTRFGIGKAPTGSFARLLDVTLSVRGLRVRTSDDLETGRVNVDQIEATVRLEESTARTRHIAATLDGSNAVTRIDLREADAASPLLSNAVTTVAYDPKTGGPDVALTGTLRVSGAQGRINDIRGTVAGGAFTGTITADTTARPRLEWDLAFDRFALIDDLDSPAPASVAALYGTPTLRASDLKDVDLAWLDRIQVIGTTHVKDARIGNARASDVVSVVTIRDGVLDISVQSQRFYDGAAQARYVLTRAQGGAEHRIDLSIQKARAQPLLSDMIGVRGLDGATTIHVDVHAHGDQLDDAMKTISGSGDLAVTDGAIDGPDLAVTSGLNTGSLGKAAASLLDTRFSRLTSTFKIDDGRATTTDLRFDSPIIDTTGMGTIDLSAQTVDFILRPALAGKGASRLDVPVRIFGPLRSPSVSTDFSGVMANPGAALESLQDLGRALGRRGGLDGLGGLLDGILPKGGAGRP